MHRAAMRFQFSIRLALLVTLAVSIGLAFYGYHYRTRQRRLHAMSQIEQDSGFVTFRNENGGIPIEITDHVRQHARLECIYLAGSKLDQTTLELLSYLNDAYFISFNSSAFADRHVCYLDGLTNLRELQLNGTLISDIGLEHLSKRHSLTLLTLNDTSIDDRAIDALVAMKSLRKLYLYKTGLSDQGLKRLESELSQCMIFH